MAWYEIKGNDGDVVFSSRVRLARNLTGYRFDEGLSEKDAKEIIDKIGAALGNGYKRTDFADVTPTLAGAMVEQHRISREFAAKKTPHALFEDDNKSVGVMACEEDHIRLQCILPGLALRDAYRFACEADDKLDAGLDIAYDDRLGYLTHCPTNLGTGMRASVMMFLPALTAGGYMGSLAAQLSKIGLTVRGLFGEGSGAAGCMYQISNQIPLGITEEEILKKLGDAVSQVSDSERKLRGEISGENLEQLTDKIRRSEGILRYAYRMSTSEFFKLFADVRFGIALGVVTDITYEQLGTLLVELMPATLTLACENAPKNEASRDRCRCQKIQSILNPGE